MKDDRVYLEHVLESTSSSFGKSSNAMCLCSRPQ